MLSTQLNYIVLINNKCIYGLKVLGKLPRIPHPLGINFSWRLSVSEVAMATLWLIMSQKQNLLYTCHQYMYGKYTGVNTKFN